jgi:DNA-binding Lrp family transcriptional regulator
MTDGGDSGATTSPSRAAAGGNGVEFRELDVLDRQIIRILQKTGRKTNTDIARKLSVTETTVRKRIAQLMDDDMINIVAVPTPKAVGGMSPPSSVSPSTCAPFAASASRCAIFPKCGTSACRRGVTTS